MFACSIYVFVLPTVNLSMLNYYFLCDGYEGYKLVYSPQNGVTCVSPCSEGYCHNGGQCQHLPNGPQCRWVGPGAGEDSTGEYKLGRAQ